MTYQDKQREFLELCGFDVNDRPTYNQKHVAIQSMLLDEEMTELRKALDDLDKNQDYREYSEVLAEAVDAVYIIMGLMNTLGLPFDVMFNAIHERNMAKVIEGKVIKDVTGKVQKPEGWTPVDKVTLLKEVRKL